MNSEMTFFPGRETLRQFVSYAVIGVLTNALGYSAYLLLTYLWGAPKLTMTLLYVVGALVSFLANRHYTFRHDGHIGVAGVRYLFVQLIGYLLNLFLLILFVDWLGFPHQIVQGVAIIVLAIFLFFLSRIFVYAQQLPKKSRDC